MHNYMKKLLFGLVLTVVLAFAVPVSAGMLPFTKLEPAENMNEEYIYDLGYEKGSAKVEYESVMDNFRAQIRANHLKPGFTYQVKFIATPSCAGGDDATNEAIGYAGRWYCPDCPGTTLEQNRTDTEYEANKALPEEEQECIYGYLVFDYFTADVEGRVDTSVVSDASYHVLWCGGDAINNDYLYPADTSLFDCDEADLKCETPMLCEAGDVIGEIERADFEKLPEGEYRGLKIALTEESFHQNCGTWATVLWGDIGFIIER